MTGVNTQEFMESLIADLAPGALEAFREAVAVEQARPPRATHLPEPVPLQDRHRLAAFAPDDGGAWDETQVAGRKYPVLTREFWTARQRQASNLHEVSYRACYKPQLPRLFIERLRDGNGDCLVTHHATTYDRLRLPGLTQYSVAP